MKSKRLWLASAALASAVAICSVTLSKADTIYDVSLTVGTGNVTGFIQTDGTSGQLSTSNIVDWNLLLSAGTSTVDTANSSVSLLGSGAGFTATNQGLYL
jgi:hypothetical protein